MASPPPLGRSKRKSVGNAVQDGVKRFKSYLQHPSSDVGGSPSFPSSNAASSPPSRPASLGPPIAPQCSSVQSNSAAPSALAGPTSGSFLPTPTTGIHAEPHPSKPTQTTTSVLTSLLQAMHIGSDLVNFSPLKPAISGVVDCLDIVQAATTSAKEYEELTLELNEMARALKAYIDEQGFEDISDSAICARIGWSIEAEVEHIMKKKDRNKIRRAAESLNDMEDVIQCYRRVEGMFRQLHNEICLQSLRNSNNEQLMRLHECMDPVDDARYNSGYSTTIERRGCTKETREQVQADLQNWAQDPNGAKVYWMNGMAGTGKTTIAYSLCEWLETHQKLGASFFCSRASSLCRNVNSIIPTVAYELARHFPSFRSALHKALRWDPGARKLNVTQQFEKIILDPIVSLTAKCPTPIDAVIVIDALDECEDEAGVRLVLQALLRFSAQLQLKFFVTSRPEPAIRDKMLSPGGYSPAVLHLHDIEQSIVEGDVKKYLAEGLEAMSPPPSVGQIEQLTKLAGKLFIYAATVTRYILPGKAAVNSTTRLNAILAADYQVAHQGNSGKKYKPLDELYTTVLAVALDDDNLEEEEIEAVRLVLWTAVCAKEPISIPTLASLLSLAQEQVSSALQPLRSVLHVSEHDEFVSPFHASFPDFLYNPSRSGRFCCKQTSQNELMANSCFSLMRDQLRFNICKLETSSTLDKDVPDLAQRITGNISPSLFYACIYWVDHLCLTGPSDTLHDTLVDFLSHRLLFWMEVLNLRQSIAKGITILSRAEIWLQALSNSAAARQLTSDANDFVSRFAGGECSGSTPHIYISALPFCTKFSSVYARYWGRTRGLIDQQGTMANRGNRLAQATWMVNARVYSVAITSDGSHIISGDDSGNIYIRDGRTGNLIDVGFPKHDGAVRSLALSRDGTRIASGFGSSSKYPIQVWDASTGDSVIEPFGLLLGTVSSVAFSPDCRRIASSSDTCTVRLWDASTGNPIFPSFYGHTDSINSIALSPDGGCIASGSSDCTVRLWNATTGDIVAGPFRGHTGSVNSVVFSSDGTRIASGSDDETIGVWDTQTGNLIVNRLQGHSGSVNSVAFSPDGTLIASGSSDTTIQVWDVHSGKTITGPFHGHEGPVNSVAFSPDGTRIASGSSDGTTLVWGVWAGVIKEGPLGERTKSINSVAFSHDGTCVVWGSDDGVIQVWNSFPGNVSGKSFFGHESNVRSVAFSYDDTLIVSSSDDCTIRLWDRLTGRAATEQPIESVRPVKAVAFSRDSAQVFSCAGGDIRAWNVTSGSPSPRLGPFQGHTGWITSVAFSRNGRHIFSGSEDKTIRVWDASTGGLVAGPLYGHTGRITSVAFSPDGTRIVSGSSDKTVRVWYAHMDYAGAGPLLGHTGSINSVVFSPDGRYIASGADNGTLRVWSTRSVYDYRDYALTFTGHTGSICSVVFSPGSTRVISGSDDRSIRVWAVRDKPAIHDPDHTRRSWVHAVAFSPDGTSIVSGSDDGTVGAWDVRTGNIIGRPFDGWRPSFKLIAFSLDGSRILLYAEHEAMIVWSKHTGVVETWSVGREKMIGQVPGPDHFANEPTEMDPYVPPRDWISSVVFSPDAERIALGFADGAICVRDTRTNELVADPFQGHTEIVNSVAFSPDSTHVASSSEGIILVWDVSSGNIITGPFHGRTDSVTSIAFSPDGMHIASGSTDGAIWIWDSSTGDVVKGPFQGHTEVVRSIVFSLDGKYIISNSDDPAIQVWDVRTGKVRILQGHTGPVWSVAVSPDGKSIASGSQDQVIRIWDLESDVKDFKLDYELRGWVTNDDGLAFWPPYDFHSHLPRPSNSLLITPKGSVLIDYKNLLLGKRWAECYVS